MVNDYTDTLFSPCAIAVKYKFMDHSLIFIVKQMWFTISYDDNLIIRAGYFGCIWIGKLQCEETVITIYIYACM